MLNFIMFNSTLDLRLGNNVEPCKQYISPRAQTKKTGGKKGGFGTLVQSFEKREERRKMPKVG